ncbi:MAG: hypothetical protein SF052_24020 [Bacteroidia bacterium]|nr:hypothetical protein [Bacteroidia bacterium]
MKNLYFLFLIIAWFQTSAQSLQVEVFASGGVNFSQGKRTAAFQPIPFPAGYLQGNLGYRVSPHWELGVGLTYYSLGLRNRFTVEYRGDPSFGVASVQTDYRFMPHLYGGYTFSENARFFPASRISLGLLYAREGERWAIGEGGPIVENVLPGGQILYSRFESVIEPHTFLAVEARWDVRLLHHSRHGLFAINPKNLTESIEIL